MRAAPHTSLGLHVIQCHQVALGVSSRSPFGVTHSLTATRRCRDPPDTRGLSPAVLARDNISCEARVWVPAAPPPPPPPAPPPPYPITKQRFVSMLLYASIESHWFGPTKHKKTADGERLRRLAPGWASCQRASDADTLVNISTRRPLSRPRLKFHHLSHGHVAMHLRAPLRRHRWGSLLTRRTPLNLTLS